MLVHVKEINHITFQTDNLFIKLLETKFVDNILDKDTSNFYVLKYNVPAYQINASAPVEKFTGTLEECKQKVKEWINDII